MMANRRCFFLWYDVFLGTPSRTVVTAEVDMYSRKREVEVEVEVEGKVGNVGGIKIENFISQGSLILGSHTIPDRY